MYPMKRLKFWPFYLLLILGATLANAQQKKYVLVIHGGAGTILKKNMTPEKEKAYVAALTKALTEGYAVIQSGKSSVDAVETASGCWKTPPFLMLVKELFLRMMERMN